MEVVGIVMHPAITEFAVMPDPTIFPPAAVVITIEPHDNSRLAGAAPVAFVKTLPIAVDVAESTVTPGGNEKETVLEPVPAVASFTNL